MPLTELQHFQATLAHEKHEAILYSASFIPELAQKVRDHYGLADSADLAAHFGFFTTPWIQPRHAGTPPPPTDFSPYFAGMKIPAGAFINFLGVLEIPGGFHHFTQYISPLRNAQRFEELERFPYPTSTEGLTEEGMAEAVSAIHAQGKAACTLIGHMYEDAWQVRGYEPFLMDMVAQPEWAEYILDRFMERNLFTAVAGARAGVDFLRCGDDVANQRSMMFSVEQWRQFMKPRWAKVFAAARAIKPDIGIFYHSDGNIMPIIPELIEIGVNILNPVQPECLDPVEVKKQYGRQLVFDGTIGTQTTMPFGTPDEVRAVVRERIETLGYDGALILTPTHVLEPEVPIENIEAFAHAAKEFGSK